jgi:hypothetical protein
MKLSKNAAPKHTITFLKWFNHKNRPTEGKRITKNKNSNFKDFNQQL